MQGILDEGVDELAASAHAGFWPRAIIAVAVAVAFSWVLPWRICLIWAFLANLNEAQAWFATRRQYLRLSVGLGIRLWHLAGLAVGSMLWILIGALAWISGSAEGAVCATLIWVSVIFFAQANAHQSPIGFVLGGGLPGALMLAVVLFAPHAPHMRMIPVLATVVLCLIFAAEGVTRMFGARRRLYETQAQMHQSEARYRLLTDSTSDIIVRYDLTGVIEFVSPSISQLGYSQQDLLGKQMTDFGHPDEVEVNQQSRLDTIEHGVLPDDQWRQFRVRTVAGDYIWMEGNPTPIRDDHGNMVGMMAANRDITARRAMEEALRAKTVEAEAAVLAKSEFLSNMSHEIRTPLTSIIGFSGLLDAIADLPPAARTYCARITTAGQSLLSVVNDILDFSKIEAGHIELDPHPFDPENAISETVELVLAQALVKGLSVRAKALTPLPAAINADSSRLRQVLLNLLNNALKFTAEGGVTVGVSYLTEGEGVLRIEVSDTGVGLTAEQAAKLFHRFSQADSSISRQHGGTGLGLAICKSLAELMGGEIGVDSAPGQGSTFWFTIAASQAELAEAHTPDHADVETMAPARILVVDDVAVNRELVKAMLSLFGHEISEAANGAEAVKCALHAPFDLILMDLQMPGMDGIAATHAIRTTSAANARTPIVALSANVMANHVDACRAAGMDDHIGKPIDAAELLTKVAQWTAAETRGDRGQAFVQAQA